MTIGGLAVLNNTPAVFAGNLLGATIVLFLGIIPLLGIVGNGVTLPSQLNHSQLMITLIVILAPAVLTVDREVTSPEAYIMIGLYLLLGVVFSFKQSWWEKAKTSLKRKTNGTKFIAKIVVGTIIVLGASHQILNSTLFFAQMYHISPFFLSLLVVSLGTNLPELSIVFRSIAKRKKDIAFADYLGSASANTLLFGALTLAHGSTFHLPNHFLQRFTFILVGLVLFFFFARSKSSLSRKESLVLFGLYCGFLIFELLLLQ